MSSREETLESKLQTAAAITKTEQKAPTTIETPTASVKAPTPAALAAQAVTEEKLQAKAVTAAGQTATAKKVAETAILQTGAERIAAPDIIKQQTETLQVKESLATHYTQKYTQQLNEQNKLKQALSNDLSAARQDYETVVANKDKYEPASYQAYVENYKTYEQEVSENLKTVDENVKSLKAGLASTSMIKAEIKTAKAQLKVKPEPIRIKAKELPEVIESRLPSKPLTENQKKYKDYIDRMAGINYLINKGAAEKKGDKIILKTAINTLPDDLYKAARQAGFEAPDIAEGPSFKLLEWGQKATEKGSFARSQTEYYSVVLGQGEQAIQNIANWVGHAITGKTTDWRKVSPETIEYIKDLSPQQRTYLALGARGGAFLGSYVATVPVGMAVSEVFRGAAAIAKATGATTPARIKAIASEIAKHPNLARGIMYGGMVGIEADKVYKEYKAGKIEDLMGEVTMRAAYLTGSVLGFESGVKVDAKLREWWATRGRTLIPPEAIMTPETLETGEFPTYKAASRYKWSNEFKDLAKKLTAEDYLGKLAPEEYRVWHATGNQWELRVNGVTEAAVGESLNKFPGLFVAPEPSPYFLRLGTGAAAERGAARLGLPGLTGPPELITMDALVEVMPKGMTQKELWGWLQNQLGKSTAYIPPVSMITPEMEAIVPAGTKLVKIGAEWYTNWAGHRVLVNKYALLPIGTPISVLPKGSEIISLGELISRSPTVTDTYLAWGIIPPSSVYGKTELSDELIKSLAKTYGLSTSEIRNLVSSTALSLSDISSLKLKDVSSTPFKPSDLRELVEPTRSIKVKETSMSIPVKPSRVSLPTSITEPAPLPSTPMLSPPPSIPEPPPPPSTPEPPTTPGSPPPPPSVKIPGMKIPTLQFYTGKKMVFRVVFTYPRGGKETIRVEARSYPEAMQLAQRARSPRRDIPVEVNLWAQ